MTMATPPLLPEEGRCLEGVKFLRWMFLPKGALQLRFHVVPLARLSRLLKPLPFPIKVRRLMVMAIPSLSEMRG